MDEKIINKKEKMSDSKPWEFTCKTCGGHKLTVSHLWIILAGPDSESWQEWGPLDANHHWDFEFKEKIQKNLDLDDEGERWNWGKYLKDTLLPNLKNMKYLSKKTILKTTSIL